MKQRFLQEDIQAAQNLINSSSRIVLTSHKSPDGDAVGSGLAMLHYLLKKGKEVVFIVPDQYPEFLQWLPGHAEVLVYERDAAVADLRIKEADLIFSLDYNQLNRTGVMCAPLEKAGAAFILIDHHHSPGDYPAVVFSDTAACSTCEMVYDFITESGDSSLIDRISGTCIYTGIMTDSGSFRFPSVTPHTHNIVSELIAKGVDHSFIHRQVYDNNLLNRLQLLGYALSSKLEMIGEHAAMIALDKETLNKYNHQPGDTEGLVNYALSIKGVNVAAFVREGSNEVRLSLRSKGDFDVNLLAREYFEGGGHTNAAGGRSQESLEKTVAKLKEILLRYSEKMNY